MKTLIRGYRWIAEEPRHRTGLRVLQGAIGLMLFFRIFTEWRFAPYFYGPGGLGRGSTAPILGPPGAVLDLAFRSDAGVFAMMLVLACGAFGLVYGFRTRLATLCALVPFFMMEQRLPHIGDGGDNVTRLVLMYMLFALGRSQRPSPGGLAVWLHNIAVLAIVAQLLVVYETSGIMKVMGEKWHNGTALYYITQVDWFSHPLTRALFKNPFAVTLGTFLPIVFLVFFPLAVCTRLKPFWIAFGILFHLSIAFAMGLVTFATVMIGLELFLFSDAEFERARHAAARAADAIRRRMTNTGRPFGARPLVGRPNHRNGNLGV